ncbi:MAG: AAA domain-containing protein [Candidatus Paceibacterota bacterium]|jgi:superfamily I DNA and/or RNA helicase/very-short-patch-repair endonuclease
MEFSLNSYIKYCLGYLSLTRPTGFNRGTSLDIKLPQKYFSLTNLINGDTDGNLSEIVNLDCYYNTDPKDITEEIAEQYKAEKALALQIDEIYNKAKNDSFTKETILRFGKFDFEVLEEPIIENEEEVEENIQLKLIENAEAKLVLKQFYLFSLPVRVDKEKDKNNTDRYSITPVDFEVRLNLPPLYEIFRTYKKEDLVYEFLNDYVKMESEEAFSIPITSEKAFLDLWHILKAKLKLTEATFNEKSFTLEELRLTLAPRANFFLVEDLTKLSREKEELLENTSLSGWFSEEGLNINSDVCEEKALYFPFPYDKFQRATTSLLGNKASIIQGPPGTGKSETISNIISHLAVNKNKVLFVSQKPQALRVVKDKLKTLEVPLLFGYIPSVKFQQLNDEESDTISSQLASLDTYGAQKNNIKDNSNLGEFTQTTDESLSKRDRSIALERNVYELEEKKCEYDFLQELPELNEEKILTNLTEELHSSYIKTQKRISENNTLIESLEAISRKYNLDRGLFSDFAFSDLVKTVLLDVKKTGFDRSFNLGRYINNLSRKIRLKSHLTKLPKEIYEEINSILGKDISRHIATQELEQLLRFCSYWEATIENEKLEISLKEIEDNLDLSRENLSELFKFLKEKSITATELVVKLSDRITLNHDQKNLVDEITKLKKEVTSKNYITRKEIISQYLSAIIEDNIKRNVSQVKIYRKLQELQKAFKKSKKAFKTFDKLKSDPNNFETILNVVPVWIMDLDDASRLIPLVANLFDYVVFDEASQCNIAYTIPSMYRAKKSIFVGDPEQMRDSTVMFKSNNAFDQLASRFKVPESLQIKPTGTAVQSVLDIAKTRFGIPKILQYHYRSPMELIGFSNKYFYEPKGKRLIALNNKYLTYQDTNRIMVLHNIQNNGVGEISDNTNRAEAIKAFELYQEMVDDPKYEGKTFAVLTFFNDQAELIRKVFEDNRIKESEKLKIAVIEGIQGDEKDIIIYSFVIRDPSQKRQYIPLTGETGDIKADINAGRVNVAFSRARLQVHCILSLPIEKIPNGIWIKKYLEYVRDNGEVSASKLALKKFDSFFEEEFYYLLKKKLGRGYTIQNQVESCGFKIDFVITNLKNGNQLAIECDGPTHFKDNIDEAYGIYVESDIQRQQVLESAGWNFFRIGYSEWIEDDEGKEKIVGNIKLEI